MQSQTQEATVPIMVEQPVAENVTQSVDLEVTIGNKETLEVLTRPVDKDVNDVPFTIEVQTDAAIARNDRLPHNSTHVLEEITAEAHGDVQSIDLEQVAPSVALTAHHVANSSHDAAQVTIQPHTSKNVQHDLDLWARIKEYDQLTAKEGFTQVLSKKQQLNMKKQVLGKPHYQTRAKGGPSPSSK
jgi:hypothetical protein